MEQIKRKRTIYEAIFKRPLDFILSLFAIIILSPLMLIVAIFVRIKLGSPILFRQERPGKNENLFVMYKFRSMTDDKDASGNLLSNDKRRTKFGNIIRALSIDELPGLFNVLKGEMSLIGPRPLLIQYLPYYRDDEKIRHVIRPGLTGLAQINGRNSLTWDERLKFDIEYTKKITILNDTKIFFLTIFKVFRKSGVTTVGEVNFKNLDVERSEDNVDKT